MEKDLYFLALVSTFLWIFCALTIATVLPAIKRTLEAIQANLSEISVALQSKDGYRNSPSLSHKVCR